MAQEIINNGTFDNDPSAEKIRTAFDKVNNNFTEVYANNESLNIIQNVGLSTNTLNTWRTWTKEQGLWFATNTNLGTGTEPTRSGSNYENFACFFIQEKTKLNKFTWWWRRGNIGDYEVLVRSYDWNEDTGEETNVRRLPYK
jgi:hypothetical protein